MTIALSTVALIWAFCVSGLVVAAYLRADKLECWYWNNMRKLTGRTEILCRTGCNIFTYRQSCGGGTRPEMRTMNVNQAILLLADHLGVELMVENEQPAKHERPYIKVKEEKE